MKGTSEHSEGTAVGNTMLWTGCGAQNSLHKLQLQGYKYFVAFALMGKGYPLTAAKP